MSLSPVIVEPAAAADPEGVVPALHGLFVAMRDAVLEGRPVVVLLDDGALLGQAEPHVAAIATAALGMVRAIALEGAREGWIVNAVSSRPDDAEQARRVAGRIGEDGLTGQHVRLGTRHIGKVIP